MPETCDRRRRLMRLCPAPSLLLLSRGTGREQVLNRPFSHQQFLHPTTCHRPSAATCRLARRTGPQQDRNKRGTGSPRTNGLLARQSGGPGLQGNRLRQENAKTRKGESAKSGRIGRGGPGGLLPHSCPFRAFARRAGARSAGNRSAATQGGGACGIFRALKQSVALLLAVTGLLEQRTGTEQVRN